MANTGSNHFLDEPTLYPRLTEALRWLQATSQVVGMLAVVIHHGLARFSEANTREINVLVLLCMLMITFSVTIRYFFSRVRKSFLSQHRIHFLASLVWLIGLAFIGGGVRQSIGLFSQIDTDWHLAIFWTEFCLVFRGIWRLLHTVNRLSRTGNNPAILLGGSFLFLIIVGTGLLMLPVSRAQPPELADPIGAPFITALFTSTSASCVTGLIVVPTGSYWSTFGQVVILSLFQIGGLGIMTWGALLAVASGRSIHVRQSATMGEMLESNGLSDLKRLLLTILLFTLMAELIGAVAISGLWSDRPLGEQSFYSLFHAVSAFCNAGFSLQDDGLLGMGERWQVWGGMAALIICGGIGFSVIYNLVLILKSKYWDIERTPLFSISKQKTRLTLSSRLVLVGTSLLLLAGTFSFFFLESLASEGSSPLGHRWADAWFQSVTMRTAGFNTVDLGEMQTSSKLVSIGLMFIGASPGSTGGGIKVVCFMLIGLSLVSIYRGRPRVEWAGRSVPDESVKRALTIVTVGVMTVMLTTLLLTIFENRPGEFIDILYEATSAFGTVGVSTGLTAELSPPSQIVIMVTMFLGRIGPLTLLLALSRTNQGGLEYEYPEERVMLG
ncbi:Ktr system potassium uptake protein B [Polystyrenella longa]|uniref:Ktr system potassium uptake protein B n=1 Tax=Polystyrenella longa TaxID=2528007 RepID=A0A518CNX9_9PLAN|nr:potassium transporter TrkG [Polystyrenella longa]QDU80923.1 Ktr system potassium uptake protein B [Polystyrenella longa]